jgi:type II secretory pathway component PulK
MTLRARERGRPGFALLAVLWVLAGAATVAAFIALDVRSGTEGARNRLWAEQAYWSAFGCAERARFAIDKSLAAAPDDAERRLVWILLRERIAQWWLPEDSTCHLRLEAVGERLNVNRLDVTRLRRFLDVALASGSSEERADALLDWLDPDDLARVHGAEREWYEAHDRIGPRNGPLVAPGELRLIRGFEALYDSVAPLIATEPTPISLNHAPRAVLATLPGATPEVIQRLLDRRAAGTPLLDLREITHGLSVSATEGVLRNFSELAELSVVDPPAWVISVESKAGSPPITERLEVTVVRGAANVVVTARRTW